MNNEATPKPTPAEPLLIRPYSSSQKGGTLIVGAVTDVATHEALLASGGYRPSECPTCLGARLHIHDYRHRRCQVGDEPTTKVVRIRCAAKDCGATWQILPGFIPRWLHFNWPVAEAHSRGTATRRAWGRPPSPRTIKRWRQRLGSSSAPLRSLVSDTIVRTDRRTLARAWTRLELVDALAWSFAGFASWLHMSMAGVRLM